MGPSRQEVGHEQRYREVRHRIHKIQPFGLTSLRFVSKLPLSYGRQFQCVSLALEFGFISVIGVMFGEVCMMEVAVIFMRFELVTALKQAVDIFLLDCNGM